MARLRYNGLSATLGGSLTSSATAVTFGAALTHSNGTNVPTITGSDYIPLSILDASGHLSEIVYLTAYTAGATTGTIARGKEGTSGVSHSSGDKVIRGLTAADLGGILATCRYAPATFTQVSTTSTTMGDVDATNLVVTFTAPPSGNVVVSLNAYNQMNGIGTNMQWALRDGSTTVAGSIIQVSYDNQVIGYRHAQVLITGLTPGQSYTWKWAWRRTVGSATLTLSFGDDSSGLPASMVVTAAP